MSPVCVHVHSLLLYSYFFTLFLSGTRCHVTVKVDKVAIEVWVKRLKGVDT